MKKIFALAWIGLLPALAVAGDWPQFLGPTGDNISKEDGLLDTFPAKGPRVVFAKRVGTGYSPVSVRDGKVVVFHRASKLIKAVPSDTVAGMLDYINGELAALGSKERVTKETLRARRGYLIMPDAVAKAFDREIIDCLDAKTGKIIWRKSYPTTYEDPYGFNNGPRCAPLLTKDHCYTYGAQGVLICSDLKTGKQIWRRDVLKEFKVIPNFFGVGSTPVLEGNLLITMTGGQPNSGMTAFNAKTGKTVWTSVGKDTWNGTPKLGTPGEPFMNWLGAEKLASYASPVIATVHGQRVAFCLMRQGLVALNPKTGKVHFKRWFSSSRNESVNASNPVIIDDHVFASSCYYGEGSFLLKIKKDLTGYDVVWSTLNRRKAKRDHEEILGLHWMTPVYLDGHLYASHGRNEPDSRFRCIDLLKGQLKWDTDQAWTNRFGEAPPKKIYGRSSYVYADGKFIVLGETGKLGLFKMTPAKSTELAAYHHPNLHYPCWAGPALANKKLYIRSESHLICLDIAK